MAVKYNELRKQVGEVLHSAIESLEVVKENIVRSSQIGRYRLDATFQRRERDRLLLRLGEQALQSIEKGEWDPPSPIREAYEGVKAVEDKMALAEQAIGELDRAPPEEGPTKESPRRSTEPPPGTPPETSPTPETTPASGEQESSRRMVAAKGKVTAKRKVAPRSKTTIKRKATGKGKTTRTQSVKSSASRSRSKRSR